MNESAGPLQPTHEPDTRQRLPVGRVYPDASRRGARSGWGAVVVAPNRMPNVMGCTVTGQRTSTGIEAVATVQARDAAQRWLRRYGLRAELLVVHSDNQSATWNLQDRKAGARVAFRWIAREHPMLRIAHQRARQPL